MRWVLACLVLVTGCGRVGFDAVDSATDVAVPHDEDADGVADTSDNCPHRVNTDQLDGDLDGVGDICDPNAGSPTEELLLFAPFVDSSGPFTLVEGGATHTFQGDALRIEAIDSTGGVEMMIATRTVGWFAFTVDVLEIGTSTQQQLVIELTLTTQPTGYYGEIYDSAIGLPHLAIGYYDDTSAYAISTVPLAALPTGTIEYEYTIAAVPPRATHVQRTPAELSVTSSAAEFVGGNRIQLRVSDMRVDVRYLTAIVNR